MEEIKASYRRLALKYHPDKNTSKKDDEKFKLVTEAYRALRTADKIQKNPDTRARYGVKTLGSITLPWSAPCVDRVLKDCMRCIGFVERAYVDVCKFEQGSWDYWRKTKRHTAVTASFIKFGDGQVLLYCSGRVSGPDIKKELDKIKSNCGKFLSKNV